MNIKPFENYSDEDLIEKIKADHLSELYTFIYARYHSKVLEKCNSLLHHKELATEFSKDILSKAFEKLDGFKGNSSFSSWLYSITYNHCIDYLRLRKRLHYPHYNQQHEIPEIVDEIEEDLSSVHYERLIKLLDLLHTEEKAMLLMKYQDDLSIKQIAESMRLTEGAVKMRMKRAKARLMYLYKTLYGSYN